MGERGRAWVGRACVWAEPGEEEKRPVLPILFFFLKNMNSGSFVYFSGIFVELQKL
jgi:hypothetical protein